MGLPGPVLEDGHVEFCVNLGWKAMNPQKILKRPSGRDAGKERQ